MKNGPAQVERGPLRATGKLYVVATPIGNLEDVTLRAIRTLKEVGLIASEDTRRTRILLDKYGILTPLTSLHDNNEAKKSEILIERLLSGEDVACVSDAGTPGISDPGYILIRKSVAHGIRVVPIPGVSAMVAAISVSGLPMDSFVFLGFLPSKPVRRMQTLTSLREEKRTLIFYESPHRLLASLSDIAIVMGDRELVVSREMTKIYEEFLRGSAAEIIRKLEKVTIRGEITLIVGGCAEDSREYSDEEIAELCGQILSEAGEEISMRDIADRISGETGVARRRIYRLLQFS